MRLGINLIFIHLCCCGVVTYLRHACLCMSEFLYFPFYEIKTVPQFSCLFYFLSLIFLMIKVLSKTLACLAVSCTPTSSSRLPLLKVKFYLSTANPSSEPTMIWLFLAWFSFKLLLYEHPLLALHLYFLVLAFACITSGFTKPFGHSTIWLLPEEQVYCQVSFFHVLPVHHQLSPNWPLFLTSCLSSFPDFSWHWNFLTQAAN